jgi:hypothetical protein
MFISTKKLEKLGFAVSIGEEGMYVSPTHPDDKVASKLVEMLKVRDYKSTEIASIVDETVTNMNRALITRCMEM